MAVEVRLIVHSLRHDLDQQAVEVWLFILRPGQGHLFGPRKVSAVQTYQWGIADRRGPPAATVLANSALLNGKLQEHA